MKLLFSKLGVPSIFLIDSVIVLLKTNQSTNYASFFYFFKYRVATGPDGAHYFAHILPLKMEGFEERGERLSHPCTCAPSGCIDPCLLQHTDLISFYTSIAPVESKSSLNPRHSSFPFQFSPSRAPE